MSNALARLLGTEQKTVDATNLMREALFGDIGSKSGVRVNTDTALRVSAAFACGRVLAEDVAKLPFRVYREQRGGRREPATDHPLYWLLYRRPNDWQTAFEFRETMMFHALFAKGGFAYISRSSDGRILELLPILPGSITIRQQPPPSREVVYEVADKGGVIARFARADILHVRGPSWDTVQAMQLVDLAREVLGLSIAIEESQARLHANGARPSGILTTDKTLTQQARARLKEMFAEGYQGVMNAGKVPVLDDGLKFMASVMTGVDAQTLESRRHQVEEVCRMFRVYPQKIGYTQGTTAYASVEQFFIAHAVDTVSPWAERWEQAVERDCLTRDEVQAGVFVKMSLQALMRGDNASRAAFYKSGINDGWMTRNEARALEDVNPIDGLDTPLMPLNMTDGSKPLAPPGEPDPADPAAPATDPSGATVVQDTALNGAQVASLLSIVNAVAAGQLPKATARAMILAAFPGIADGTVDAMLNGLDGFTPAAPAPAPSASQPADP